MSDIVEIWNGCTAAGIEVNGVRVEHMKKEDYNSFLDRLMVAIREGVDDGTISLDSVIGCMQYDEVVSVGGTCEQCGDSVEKTVFKMGC